MDGEQNGSRGKGNELNCVCEQKQQNQTARFTQCLCELCKTNKTNRRHHLDGDSWRICSVFSDKPATPATGRQGEVCSEAAERESLCNSKESYPLYTHVASRRATSSGAPPFSYKPQTQR